MSVLRKTRRRFLDVGVRCGSLQLLEDVLNCGRHGLPVKQKLNPVLDYVMRYQCKGGGILRGRCIGFGVDYMGESMSTAKRWMASSSFSGLPPLEGVPWSVSRNEAQERFISFCNEKGAKMGLMISNALHGRRYDACKMQMPAYIPVYVFDFEVRTTHGRRLYHEIRKDKMIYAGYSFHRGLLAGLLSTETLRDVRPFDSRWIATGATGGIEIMVDAWSVYRMTAWDVVRKQASDEERQEVKKMWGQSSPDEAELQCSFALCGVRRVYLPVWVFTYDFFGQEFHVFVSGQRSGPPTSGIDHGNMYTDLSEGLDDIRQSVELRLAQLRSFAPRTPSMATPYLNRLLIVGMVSGLQMIFSVGRFLVLRFPLAWPAALGLFVIFKKIYAPQRALRLSWEDWAQQAREELGTQQREGDSWTWKDEHVRQQQSSGSSRRYYDERESQRRSQRESQSRARQRQADHRKHSSSFDHMSPEEILGITSGASLEEVKAAFRRQMLLYHPDQQAGKSESDQAYALARHEEKDDEPQQLVYSLI